ncbi:MAG: TolC family protein [Blastocatellia bacterium]
MTTKSLRAAARHFASLSLAVCCTLPAALPAIAQDPATTPTQQQQQQPSAATSPAAQQTPPPTSSIVSRPIPQRTVGLDPSKVVRWTLRDAVTAALAKNVDIELERENVRLKQYDLIAAQGYYDPAIVSQVLYNRSSTPTSSRFTGATSNAISRDGVTFNGGLRKNFERYGTTFSADLNNQRLGSNTNNLEVQYSPALTFQITQPLFKNFRMDANRRLIKVTRKSLDLSDAVFRQRVIEIISNVQQAYWDLALAIRNEGIGRESVGLAETQLNNNKRQVEVGTLAPIDVVSAATQVETRRQQVFQAINSVALAENTLKGLTVSGPSDELWTSRIEPVESFNIAPISLPLDDAVRLAQENRPEIKQFGFQKEINQIDIDYYRNQAKPQIDLIAGYTTTGLAGSPASSTITTGNCATPIPLLGADGKVDASKLYCAPSAIQLVGGNPTPVNLPIVPFTTSRITQPASIDNAFIGGYPTALGNLFRNEFRTISFGLQITLPLRNRTAKANLGRAQEVVRQTDLQARRLLQNIEVEVRNAVQSAETAKMRIEAAKAAREYAQQQLEGEEKKFAAGLSTTFFILQRQNDLSQAQYAELQALADYNKSVATLQRVVSTTLSSNGVEIQADTPVTIK